MQKTYVSVSEENVASINESSISETCWGGGGGGGGGAGGGGSIGAWPSSGPTKALSTEWTASLSKWFQSMVVLGKKACLYCSVLQCGTV